MTRRCSRASAIASACCATSPTCWARSRVEFAEAKPETAASSPAFSPGSDQQHARQLGLLQGGAGRVPLGRRHAGARANATTARRSPASATSTASSSTRHRLHRRRRRALGGRKPDRGGGHRQPAGARARSWHRPRRSLPPQGCSACRPRRQDDLRSRRGARDARAASASCTISPCASTTAAAVLLEARAARFQEGKRRQGGAAAPIRRASACRTATSSTASASRPRRRSRRATSTWTRISISSANGRTTGRRPTSACRTSPWTSCSSGWSTYGYRFKETFFIRVVSMLGRLSAYFSDEREGHAVVRSRPKCRSTCAARRSRRSPCCTRRPSRSYHELQTFERNPLPRPAGRCTGSKSSSTWKASAAARGNRIGYLRAAGSTHADRAQSRPEAGAQRNEVAPVLTKLLLFLVVALSRGCARHVCSAQRKLIYFPDQLGAVDRRPSGLPASASVTSRRRRRDHRLVRQGRAGPADAALFPRQCAASLPSRAERIRKYHGRVAAACS